MTRSARTLLAWPGSLVGIRYPIEGGPSLPGFIGGRYAAKTEKPPRTAGQVPEAMHPANHPQHGPLCMGAALSPGGTMTSEERHEARYQRRKARRAAKAQAACGKTFEEVINFGNLVDAGKECCNGSRWKSSTINFEAHLLSECLRLLQDLINGTANSTASTASSPWNTGSSAT